MIDVAIPTNRNVVQMEAEKKLNYKGLCLEIHVQRMWNLTYEIIPVINGETGILTKVLRKNLEAIPRKHSIDYIIIIIIIIITRKAFGYQYYWL
jgi:hypothetical protein